MAVRVENVDGVSLAAVFVGPEDVEVMIQGAGFSARWRGSVAGVAAVFGPQTEIGREMAAGIARGAARARETDALPPPAAPERAFPGSGDPGDPGLGKPSTLEPEGPAGPDEG